MVGVGREEGLVEEGGSFHGACLVDGDSQAVFGQLDICFGAEGDATEQQIQLTR